MDEPRWQDLAACRDADPVLFFAPNPADETLLRGHAYYRHARALCDDCPVIVQCFHLWQSLPPGMREHGVWFGTSPAERRQSARRAKRARESVDAATAQV